MVGEERSGVRHHTEVSRKEAGRPPIQDAVAACHHLLDIDVGRWGDRDGVRGFGELLPGDITGERGARDRIEVGVVVPGMTGSVGHRNDPVAEAKPLAALQRPDRRRRNRTDDTPEPLHLVAIETGRALQQLPRVHQVGRTPLVDVDLQTRIKIGQHTHTTRMIQVNVRHQHRPDVLQGGAPVLQRLFEAGHGWYRTGIHEDQAVAGFQQAGGNVAGLAEVLEIEKEESFRDGNHACKDSLAPVPLGPQFPPRMKRPGALFMAMVMLLAVPVGAQIPASLGTPADPSLVWSPISMAGIGRVSGKVDSVFIDRQVREFVVSGGDWVSYLAARLGAVPIPKGSRIRVAVDSTRIIVDGRMTDLPPETRSLFGPLAMLLDSNSVLRAEVVMGPTGPGVARFVLATMSLNGFAIPESILASFMAGVGKQYPVLTRTGRELLVAVPPDGKVGLVTNGVRLWTTDSVSGNGTPPE